MLTATRSADLRTVARVLQYADVFSILTVDSIAERTHLSQEAVARAIGTLEDHGALWVGRVYDLPVLRLTADGLRYASELTGEPPVVWSR